MVASIWQLVTSCGVVQYINAKLKYANVVGTQFLILPAPDILLMHTDMPEVHYFEKFFVYFWITVQKQWKWVKIWRRHFCQKKKSMAKMLSNTQDYYKVKTTLVDLGKLFWKVFSIIISFGYRSVFHFLVRTEALCRSFLLLLL